MGRNHVQCHREEEIREEWQQNEFNKGRIIGRLSCSLFPVPFLIYACLSWSMCYVFQSPHEIDSKLWKIEWDDVNFDPDNQKRVFVRDLVHARLISARKREVTRITNLI